MSKLKRDLKRQPIPQKVLRGQQIIAACTANAAIGDVTAALTPFTTTNNQLEADHNAAETLSAQAEQASTVRDTTNDDWNTDLETLMALIETNAQGDKAKLETTTIETFEPGLNTPLGAPAQVTNVQVTNGDDPGELEITWNGSKPRPRLYLVRMCPEPYNPTTMQQIATPTRSSHIASNLTSGQQYWFEVCAVGSGNQPGPWSDPAKGRAP